MKIAIAREDDNIIAIKDYSNIKDRGEIAHIICELELIKSDLLNLFEFFEDDFKEEQGK